MGALVLRRTSAVAKEGCKMIALGNIITGRQGKKQEHESLGVKGDMSSYISRLILSLCSAIL
jgi:hypothetical protein